MNRDERHGSGVQNAVAVRVRPAISKYVGRLRLVSVLANAIAVGIVASLEPARAASVGVGIRPPTTRTRLLIFISMFLDRRRTTPRGRVGVGGLRVTAVQPC